MTTKPHVPNGALDTTIHTYDDYEFSDFQVVQSRKHPSIVWVRMHDAWGIPSVWVSAKAPMTDDAYMRTALNNRSVFLLRMSEYDRERRDYMLGYGTLARPGLPTKEGETP